MPLTVAMHNFDPKSRDLTDDAARLLQARFAAFSPLSETDRILLADVAQTLQYHPPHRNLYPAGLVAPPLRVIVSGWACRYRLLADGKRQIVCLRLPGDFIGHVAAMPLPSACATGALTEVQTVNAKLIAEAVSCRDGRLSPLSQCAVLMWHHDDVMMCDQIVRLGRQTSVARLAHFMLRCHERLKFVDLASKDSFPMPLTQEVLADVLGLSVVHMNRTIQELRRNGLLDLRNGMALMLDLNQLRVVANWSPLPRPAAGLT